MTDLLGPLSESDVTDTMAAFGLLGFASLQIGGDGEILRLNSKAAALCRKLFGVALVPGRSETAQLKALVAEAVAAADRGQPCGPSALARAKGRPLIVHVLSVEDYATPRGTRFAALALLIDPDETSDVSVPMLSGAFGLTKSEIELSRNLYSGRSLKEIAKLRQTSIATLRAQLRAVFLKTSTKRQAELVALMSRLPAQRPVFRSGPEQVATERGATVRVTDLASIC
ncbi:helix-turn-helix transcriptional regulator [Lichenihabitans psoromatis]|uniref:helix-turn-helix transcriptional regulator n=1 Tax=Lichenihabitans psoromatis TaxID=2528642 RepID=UPI0010367643|nr:helix-turn-helix transcriptional regulator [Lichenihabitans psoromatis]